MHGVDDVGVTDRVEQLGLTVVDVAHGGDDRRAGAPRRVPTTPHTVWAAHKQHKNAYLVKNSTSFPHKHHTYQLFTRKVVGMATCASLFTALIQTEMGAWNAS